MDDMNRAQRLLHDLVIEQRIHAKQLAFRLHKHQDFVSDILRRDHVDYTAIFNEILRDVDTRFHRGEVDTSHTANRIFELLTDGTSFIGHWIAPVATSLPFENLCAQTGALLKDLGGALEALATIEADGQVDEGDDVRIAEYAQKVEAVTMRLRHIMYELQSRRAKKKARTL